MVPTMPETETILLCDDEGGIRRLVSTILGRHGYHVLEARSGKHAMVVAEAHVRADPPPSFRRADART